MSATGRPVELDEEKRKTICLLVRAGCSPSRAAEYLGFDESTVRKFAARDAEFRAALGEASVKMEMEQLGKIRNWTDRSWRASAWLLEKGVPSQYGTGHEKAWLKEEKRKFNAALKTEMEEEQLEKERARQYELYLERLRQQQEEEQKQGAQRGKTRDGESGSDGEGA